MSKTIKILEWEEARNIFKGWRFPDTKTLNEKERKLFLKGTCPLCRDSVVPIDDDEIFAPGTGKLSHRLFYNIRTFWGCMDCGGSFIEYMSSEPGVSHCVELDVGDE